LGGTYGSVWPIRQFDVVPAKADDERKAFARKIQRAMRPASRQNRLSLREDEHACREADLIGAVAERPKQHVGILASFVIVPIDDRKQASEQS